MGIVITYLVACSSVPVLPTILVNLPHSSMIIHQIRVKVLDSILTSTNRGVTASLAIDQGNAGDLILVVVVLIFIASFDQLLLRLLQTKWSHQSLTFT